MSELSMESIKETDGVDLCNCINLKGSNINSFNSVVNLGLHTRDASQASMTLVSLRLLHST